MRVLPSILTVMLALILATGLTNAATVDVVANFDGGGTDALPVTDVIDAYNGTAGAGWAEGWYKYTNNVTYTVGTSTATPLATGAGNYLDLTMTPASSSSPGRYASVHRSYATGIDVSQSHSMEFKYRVNEDISNANPDFGLFTTSNDRYQLFDDPTYAQGNSGPNCSWIIGCYGGEATWLSASKRAHWVVFNGDNNDTAFTDERNIDTSITVTQGAVYDFHIDIDAVTKTWDVRIGSGGTTLYDSTIAFPNGLGWRCNNATVAGLPHFASFGDTVNDTRSYSFDSLKITGVPLGPGGGMSTVAAHFTGGNSDTVVDAYVGKPGDGWRTAWATAVTRTDVVATIVSPGDTGFSELHAGRGAYLSVTATQSTADATGLAAVTRDYKTTTGTPGIDWTKQHTIKFTVRIDENVATFTDFDDRYLMYDASASQSGASANCTWMITAYGAEGTYAGADVVRQWSFYNGDRLGGTLSAANNVDTNIDIATGGVYDFTIVVDPTTRSYDATVSNGTNSFTANDLGWRTSGAQVGGYLSFATRSSTTGEIRAFSLDEVVITQAMIPGDTNGNGIVDVDDAKVVAQNWGSNVGTGGFAAGDFNGDGVVNAADTAILAANWGNHNGESVAGVPEPSMIVLLAAGLALFLTRRRS
jgi:hypothetical protein